MQTIDILGAVLGFFAGALVSLVCYFLQKRGLRDGGRKSRAIGIMLAHQGISFCLLLAVYLSRNMLPCAFIPVLIGLALGLTVPNILLSALLKAK